ncbi:MAG TPA: hypothetical protein VNY32_10985 [Candidatus Acidoferrales bacterium]|nr:hypothetical protein [Candidatus Acidoferrales bacterium]
MDNANFAVCGRAVCLRIAHSNERNERVSGTDTVTVNLGRRFSTVAIYDSTLGASPTQSLKNVSSVQLTLSDHPMIIEITH